jgi:hypothetical protein
MNSKNLIRALNLSEKADHMMEGHLRVFSPILGKSAMPLDKSS